MTNYKCNKIVTEETNVQVVEWVPVCLMLMLSVILMIMAVVYSVVVLFSFFCFGLFEFRLLRKINVRAVENVDCLSISL